MRAYIYKSKKKVYYKNGLACTKTKHLTCGGEKWERPLIFLDG